MPEVISCPCPLVLFLMFLLPTLFTSGRGSEEDVATFVNVCGVACT